MSESLADVCVARVRALGEDAGVLGYTAVAKDGFADTLLRTVAVGLGRRGGTDGVLQRGVLATTTT